jgi:hypothetical protein
LSSFFSVENHVLMCFRDLGQRTAASNGKSLTCVWCRATWVAPRPAGAAGGAKRVTGGYLNLAGVAGVSPVRDTSTCELNLYFYPSYLQLTRVAL